MPYHTLLHIYNELSLFFTRILSPFINYNWKKKLRDFSKPYMVNIAPGNFGLERWINIDCVKAKNIIGVFDVRRKIPLPNHSVKVIFCEHFLEHLDYYHEVPIFLNECYRILIRGGVIRIVVPDTVAYMEAYFDNDGLEMMSRLRNVQGLKTKMEVINKVFRQGIKHHFAYDQETLFFVLQNAAFKPSAWSYGKSQMENLTLDRPERRRESLYVEGLKE